MFDYSGSSRQSDYIEDDIPLKPKKSCMKTMKMLMKIPKETNFSNKSSSKYFNDDEPVQKNQFDFTATKYSTVTPIKGKYIKQLEEYDCEDKPTIK